MAALTLAAGAGTAGSLAMGLPLGRALPVDAFRGVTILFMVFVNMLQGMRGMPAWLYHAPPLAGGGMTFPDVILPAFLFIVGMSVPFAMTQRLAAGESRWKLVRHLLTRTLGLLVLGVFMVNAEEGYDEKAMPLPIGLWSLLFYACAFLVWSVYPFQSRRLATLLRFAGAGGFIVLVLLFHGADGNRWMTPQWWGILGLIGWAYLFTGALFLLSRGRMRALTAALLGCLLFYGLAHLDVVQSSSSLQALARTDNAMDTAIALCGVLTALIFFRASGEGVPQRFATALFFAAALLAAGFLLRPYYTISKIDATLPWALCSAAICVMVFAFLYWLTGVKGASAWTKVLRPAATAPLLTYMIPGIVWALMQTLHLKPPVELTEGAAGLFSAAACTVAVLALAAGLSRLNIRLQL